MPSVKSGIERFVYEYHAHPHQKLYHECPLPFRLLGGAAGPGKTYALIMEHLLRCNQFSAEDAPQVHTLLLRRTFPKLEATLITRFREKIPPQLYRDYNEQKHTVTWLNGSSTTFASMQYEHDVWNFQGQWLAIGYDELTEFVFSQWQNISAWNRCPVSKNVTKDGATNPIGIGARWVEDLFIKKQPCPEMDANQRKQYDASKHAYFAATYLDNPIYANDEQYIANLDSYQGPIAEALKHGIWGVAGGYFDGAWDEAYNVYAADSVEFKPWHKRWLGGDWGFEHNSAIHWFSMDDLGIVRVYRELVCNRHTPEELAERIAAMSTDAEGHQEIYEFFSLSHDAFAQRHDTNPIAIRIGEVLKRHGIVQPSPSTKDKPGREQILYDFLKARVKTGEVFSDEMQRTEPVLAARLQISDACPNLIRTIPTSPRDEKDREVIAEFLGDDSLQSCFVTGTLIQTSAGEIPIEEIRIGDFVATRTGMQVVLNCGKTKIADVFELQADGHKLIGTSEHPIFNGESFVRLDSLRYGDKIAVWPLTQSFSMESSSVDTRNRSTELTDAITLRAAMFKARDCYIDEFGRNITEQSLPGCIFTTEMEIPSTMRSITWNSSRLENMGLSIEQLFQKPRSFPYNSSVLSAVKTFFGIKGKSSDCFSAPMPARRNIAAGRCSTMKHSFVDFATNPTWKADIPKVDFARILAPARLIGKRAVYNLTVANCPEYFANGVLVHNCGYGLYQMFGKPRKKPFQEEAREKLGLNEQNPTITRVEQMQEYFRLLGKKPQPMRIKNNYPR